MRNMIAISMLVLLLAAPARAQEGTAAPAAAADSSLLFVGADVGVSIPYTELKTTFLTEVEVGYGFLLNGQLGASLSYGYTRPTSEGYVYYGPPMNLAEGASGSVARMKYESVLDESILTLHAFYRILDGPAGWTPWVAFGPSAYFLRHTVDSFESTNVETQTAWGFLGSVGADIALGPGFITAIVRLPWAPIDDKTLGDTHLGSAGVQVGYRLAW